MHACPSLFRHPAACLLALCACANALAADGALPAADPGALPAIIVTGYGVEQAREETSGSLRVITAETLHQTGAVTLEDISGQVPGLRVTHSNTGSNEGRLFIRGQGDLLDNQGGRVAVVVDGVPQYGVQLQAPELLDVARIEVLKGPQGVLYGAGASAGVVHIVTQKPAHTGGTASAGLGSQNLRTARLQYDSLVSDTLALGLVAGSQRDGGFVHNVYDGSRKADAHRRSVALKASVAPGSDTVIDMRLSAHNARLGGPFNIHADPATLTPTDGMGKPLPFWHISSDLDTYTRAQTRAASLQLRHDLGPVTLSATSGWTRHAADSAFDGDGGAAPLPQLNHQYTHDALRNLFQELRLSGQTARQHWLLGISSAHNQAEKAYTLHSALPGVQASKQSSQSTGVFAQTTWSPAQRLELAGGLRWSHERLKYQAESTWFGATRNRQSSNNTSWSARATWQLPPPPTGRPTRQRTP